MFNISRPKCGRCGKTAYPTESISIPPLVFHRLCFKCSTCKKSLTVSSYFIDNDILYCKMHVPKARATPVTDSIAMQDAKKAPKADP